MYTLKNYTFKGCTFLPSEEAMFLHMQAVTTTVKTLAVYFYHKQQLKIRCIYKKFSAKLLKKTKEFE